MLNYGNKLVDLFKNTTKTTAAECEKVLGAGYYDALPEELAKIIGYAEFGDAIANIMDLHKEGWDFLLDNNDPNRVYYYNSGYCICIADTRRQSSELFVVEDGILFPDEVKIASKLAALMVRAIAVSYNLDPDECEKEFSAELLHDDNNEEE